MQKIGFHLMFFGKQESEEKTKKEISKITTRKNDNCY